MLGETRPISIVTAQTGRPDLPCKVLAKGPINPYQELPTKKTKDGLECEFTPTESGDSYVKVIYGEKEVPKSPYYVDVQSPVDITKVQIKGLEKRKLVLTGEGSTE
jgi:hypothetical protein